MENDVSRKFAIAVVAILVIILVTNNFMDLTGQPVKSVQKTTTRFITCIDNSDIYTLGYASYSDGSRLVRDSCRNIKILDEATCAGSIPHKEGVICPKECYIGACKR